MENLYDNEMQSKIMLALFDELEDEFDSYSELEDELDPETSFEGSESELDTLPKIDSKVPGIKKVPAHPCKVKRKIGNSRKFRIRKDEDITHVVVHSLGGSGRASVAVTNWKKGGGKRCSKPHYAVGRDGQIYQVVAEKFIPRASNQLNNSSIAIEHGYLKAKYPEKLYLSSSALVRDICNRYSIPKNREHILGHAEISGQLHGDPGGYWDWEYYMALVNWDGVDKTVTPYRRIMDSREARNVNMLAKKVRGHSKTTDNPLICHSYGSAYRTITPSKGKEAFCEYKARIPVEGEYVISAWWPIMIKNRKCPSPHHTSNPSVTFTITFGTSSITKIVNQKTLRGSTRKTFALPLTPQWQELANVNLKSGDIISVKISRQSNEKGLIIADSIRLLCQNPKSQPFRPRDVCIVDNELSDKLLPLSNYELGETLPSSFLIADAPTQCAYYKIKPGDTLVGIAARAYGKSKCAGSFSCALKINNHPYNKQYWSSKLTGKIFKEGRISFSPRFSGRVEHPPKPAYKASKGRSFAVIYIPA